MVCQNLFNLTTFLTKRDAWAGSFDELLLDTPRMDTPYHLPEAPAPTPRPGGHPWGTDCDDPTRRMRRSIATFESLLELSAPDRLHRCALAAPLWETRCEAGTMAEASAWLGNMTELWRRGGPRVSGSAGVMVDRGAAA